MLAATEYSDSSSGSPSPYTPLDPPHPSSASSYPPYTHWQDQYAYSQYDYQPHPKPISIPQVPPVYHPTPQVYAPTPVSYEQPSVASYYQDPSEPHWSYSAAPYPFPSQSHVYPPQADHPPPPGFLSARPLQLTIPTPTEMLIEATANANGTASSMTTNQNPNVSWDGVHMNNDPSTTRRVRRSVSTASFTSSLSSTTSSNGGLGTSPQGSLILPDASGTNLPPPDIHNTNNLRVVTNLPAGLPPLPPSLSHDICSNVPPSLPVATSLSQGVNNPLEPSPTSNTTSTLPDLPFAITPNDTISSHEKKRHYLECLEYYVLFLHQQLQLVGAAPAQLERADLPAGSRGAPYGMDPNNPSSTNGGKGMSSRSIRTLLVHMKHKNREMDAKILEEEKRFLTLRNLVAEKEAAEGNTKASDA